MQEAPHLIARDIGGFSKQSWDTSNSVCNNTLFKTFVQGWGVHFKSSPGTNVMVFDESVFTKRVCPAGLIPLAECDGLFSVGKNRTVQLCWSPSTGGMTQFDCA